MATKKHWFHSKSPAAKKAYIKKHPNSVFAKDMKAKTDAEGKVKADRAEKHLHGVLKKHKAALRAALDEHKEHAHNIHEDPFYADNHKAKKAKSIEKIKKIHADAKKAADVLNLHRKRKGLKGEKIKLSNDKQIARKLRMHDKLAHQKEFNKLKKDFPEIAKQTKYDPKGKFW